MRSIETAEPGAIRAIDIDRPVAGAHDIVVRIRACGICGSDVSYIAMGGVQGADGAIAPTPLGHEPAGEIVEVGEAIHDLAVGDRVVINPMAAPSGVIGNGGALGAMRDYLLIENAVAGHSVAVIPDSLPFDVAALNEPIAVARHFVNRANPQPGEKVIVFGAGPIGLGATIWLKLRGVEHVVVADVLPERLERALAVGADAVINSSREDVAARLTELHGESANALGMPRPATDIYMDAAGVGAVIDTTIAAAKWKARLVMAAFHKKPDLIDTAGMLMSELTYIASMGYPTEIFEVTPELAAYWERFALLISHRVPWEEADHAYELALTPGAADKVVVVFDGD
ncbi:MAG TPA: zinc-binding dehydrogenase [Lacisediminihabitans sp.]|uniref:zinc-dependent alcohol dehydrogenase n=1 Tax=Lacisediminihabitans sp. TaxID=2787631 RepID=UPI002ED96A2A